MNIKIVDNKHIIQYVPIFQKFYPNDKIEWKQSEDGIIETISINDTVHMQTEIEQYTTPENKILERKYIVLLFGYNYQEYNYCGLKIIDPNKNKRRQLHFNWFGSNKLIQMAIPFIKENNDIEINKLINSLIKQNELNKDFI